MQTQHPEMTKTHAWYNKVAHPTFDDARDFFYRNPPVRSVPIWEDYIPPRLLVACTNAEAAMIKDSNPADFWSPSRLIYEIALRRGLKKLRITYVSKVGFFWERFFGEEDFIGHTNRRHIPVLIITTGQMRNYNAYGGETMDVLERIQEIGGKWDIPVEQIPSLI